MLILSVPEYEEYNNVTNIFTTYPARVLKFEHSLYSISKWESKWGKAFLNTTEMTPEQSVDYIRCMLVDEDTVLPEGAITESMFRAIHQYISAPMTATFVREKEGKAPSRKIITSELIYYYMTAFNIPFSCDKWHLNRLLMLIKVCEAESQPKKKMSRNEILRRNHALNAQRRAKHGTKG